MQLTYLIFIYHGILNKNLWKQLSKRNYEIIRESVPGYFLYFYKIIEIFISFFCRKINYFYNRK